MPHQAVHLRLASANLDDLGRSADIKMSHKIKSSILAPVAGVGIVVLFTASVFRELSHTEKSLPKAETTFISTEVSKPEIIPPPPSYIENPTIGCTMPPVLPLEKKAEPDASLNSSRGRGTRE
jgi:hypothetical protein